MTETITIYICQNCIAPLFTKTHIIEENDQYNYILYDNTNQKIPSFENKIICYECHTRIGTQIEENTIKFIKSSITEISITTIETD